MRLVRLGVLGVALVCLAAHAAVSQPGPTGAKLSRQHSARIDSLKVFEQQIEDAIARRDVAFLDRITAPTFTRTDQNGKVEDRASVFAQIRKPPPSADIIRRTIDRSTQQVQIHGDIGITYGALEVRGPRRAFRTTSVKVYRSRGVRWQLLSHTTISTTPIAP